MSLRVRCDYFSGHSIGYEIKFGEKTYNGGSQQIALVGLREAIIRRFLSRRAI